MCKYPAPECKPIEEENEAPENETAEEDNATSEYDDEDSDSDSNYTESSTGMRSDSESDGESASGHRVTPEMVLLLMLKEHGAITEEKYAEKAEKCEKNFRSIIPALPRSNSVDTLDYTKDLSEEDANDDIDNNIANKDDVKTDKEEDTDKKGTVETNNVDNVENSENERKYIAFIRSVFDFKDNCDDEIDKWRKWWEKKNNIFLDVSKLCKEYGLEEEQEGNVHGVTKESLEMEDKMQIFQAFAKQQYSNESQKHVEDINDNTQLQENNILPEEDKIIATNINNHKEIVSMKPKKESKVDNENITSENGENLIPYNLELPEDKIKGINSMVSQDTTEQDSVVNIAREESNNENIDSKNKNNLASVENNRLEINNNPTIACIDKTEQDITLMKPDEEINSDIQNTEKEIEVMQENNIEAVQDKIIETNVSQDKNKQDILMKPLEESKSEHENLPTGKITKSFKYILKKLIRENRIPREDENDRLSDEYGEDYARHLLSFADSLDSDYENNTITKLSNDDDDESDDEDSNLREFAFFLNFYSPSSYKYILETYNTPLPELKVLYSWYLKDDHSPGITEKAFKILKEKCSVKKQTCSLMLIDVFLRNDGRYCDQVDYGQGEYYNFEDRAILAYIFVLVSLDEDWKMPIGYIFARNVPAETQAEYIRICLTHCFDAGVDVVAVTLETPTPAEYLGCSFENIRHLKTTFKHPSCDRDVAVWIDPCLALKSARQTLKVKGILKDDEDNKIKWNLIRKLRRLHTDDETDLENPECFELRNHVAKIGLTSETFSKSLIAALDVGEKLLPDMFTDIEPTKRYIAIINMLYKILDSKVTNCMRNLAQPLHVAKKYLIRLFSNEENKLSPLDRENLAWKRMQGYRYFLKGEPACGFIGFLICIESFKHLYATLVKKEKRINFINPQRLCKIQAENLVNNLRAYDWDPETLSGQRFQWFYERLFEHLEKNPQFSDKSIPLEHWPLNNRFPPTVTIKLTSGKRSYDDVYSSQYRLKKMKTTNEEDRATKLVRDYSKAMDTEPDLSIRKNMVGFLSGWIAAKFAKCLKCEACIDSLCTDKKLWFHKFITLERIYALCLPSEEIFRICWECERTLRLKGSPARLRAWVLRQLAPRFPWSSKRSKHAAHHIHLARAVIAKYMALRLPTPFSKRDQEKIVEMFQRFTTKDPDGSLDKYRLEDLEEWLDGSSRDGFEF